MAFNAYKLADSLPEFAGKVGKWLDSNQAINGLADTYGNLFGKGKIEGEDFFTAIKRAHTKGNLGKELSFGRIAGSAVGVGAAARIATGGGLYKDKNGNTDVIGIPFI